jgi:hypothetical protein
MPRAKSGSSSVQAYDVKAKRMVTIVNPKIVVRTGRSKVPMRFAVGTSPLTGIQVWKILGRA